MGVARGERAKSRRPEAHLPVDGGKNPQRNRNAASRATVRNRPSPRCISCGCTEDRACLVAVNGGQLQGCAWIIVDRAKGEGLCSACATLPQLVYAVLPSANDRAPQLRDLSPDLAAGAGITMRELADFLNRSD